MRKRALSIVVSITLCIVSSSVFAQSPQIVNSLSWLYSAQTTTGNWPEVMTTDYYSTASALDALSVLDPSNPAYTSGSQWLSSQLVSPTDYLARQIIALKRAGQDASSYLISLLLYRTLDGGFGGADGYPNSYTLDTALALQALKAANYSDSAVLYQAISFLITNQNSDGGWGFRPGTTAEPADPSNAYVTAHVLRALATYNSTFQIQDSINKAKAYLLTKQNGDGGFGSSPSNVYETSLSVMALVEAGQSNLLPLQNGINYLTTAQSANGSWNDDPYSTALALQALAKAQANLSVSSISFSKTMPQAGEAVTITATVNNSGLEAANSVVVRFYQGDPASGGAQIGADKVTPFVASSSEFGVSVTANFNEAGSKTIFVVVDPDNTIPETSETDNKSSSRIMIATGPDLAVYSEDLKPSTYIPTAGTAFTLSYTIRNLGESEAGAFTISLYDGDPGQGGTMIQTANISGISGTQVRTGTLGVTLTGNGAHTLYLVADSGSQISEISETNNTGSVTVNVGGSQMQADLAVTGMDITLTPSRPTIGQAVQVSARVRNQGSENAFGFSFEIYDGAPEAGGVLIATQELSLAAGNDQTLTANWTASAGIHDLYVVLDRENKIVETNEQNNRASVRVMSDMVDIQVSANDLSFTPSRPVNGDSTVFSMAIKNTGIKQTGAFNAALYDGDPTSNGTLLQNYPVSNISGDGSVTLTYAFTAQPKTYRFYVVADTENVVAEMYEDNNQAIRSLLIKGPGETYGPDLVPTKIDLFSAVTDSQTLAISGSALVTFQNKGDDKITNSFDVLVFEDRDGDGKFTAGVDNLLGTGTNSIALWPEGASMVNVPLSGTVKFLHSPLYAMIDSGDAILEQDETNNVMRSGSDCEDKPANPIQPVLKWKWHDGSWVTSPPVIAPLIDTNGDSKIDEKDDPYIIFVTYYGWYSDALHAVNGRTGVELFTIHSVTNDTSPSNIAFTSDAHIAVGDINNDGIPEIVIPKYINGGSQSGLLAFKNDGTLLWDNTDIVTAWNQAQSWPPRYYASIHPSSSLSIADLDGDGKPEIIAGGTAVNGDRTIKWSRPLQYVYQGQGWTTGTGTGMGQVHAATVADLDLDGKLEVLAGNTAYNADGTIKWMNQSLLYDGFSMPVNLNNDPYPEVLYGNAYSPNNVRIYLLDHMGKILWGPVYLYDLEAAALYIRLDTFVIADFDGDGETEIGIKGYNYYFILDRNGNLKKKISIPYDPAGTLAPYEGINASSPTVFDLNEDGRPELISNSGYYFRIQDGKDGTLLYQEGFGGSGIISQNVIVSDVDNDGHANLVVFGGGGSLTTPQNGLSVYSAKNNDWAPSRAIWNETFYHVTNVNDDGTIPQYESPSWLLNNTYNTQAAMGPNPNPYLTPNLTASYMRATQNSSGVNLTVRIGNGGAKEAVAGVVVSFHDGDPASGMLLGTAVTTKTLQPGDYEDISLKVLNLATGVRSLYAVVDKAGSISECNKNDNQASMTFTVMGPGATFGPDLVPVKLDLSGMVTDPVTLSVSGTAQVTLQNKGDQLVNVPFDVVLFDDLDGDGRYTQGVDHLISSATNTANLLPNGATVTALAVSGNVKFLNTPLYAMIDSSDAVLEQNETNNSIRSGSSCELRPTLQIKPPIRKWTYHGLSYYNTSAKGISQPPVVARLIDTNNDGRVDEQDVPVILFMSFKIVDQYGRGNEQIHAVRGDTWEEIFTIFDTMRPISSDGSPYLAVGDIDNDGSPEIVVPRECSYISSQSSLVAYSYDGNEGKINVDWDNCEIARAWDAGHSGSYTTLRGMPVITDLDADGHPEIIAGATVVNGYDGTIRWGYTPNSGTGSGGWTNASLVADIDLDGKQEVVAGNTVYNFDGSIKWWNTSVTDGLTAVGNLDDDPYAEIVLVTAVNQVPYPQGARVYILDHNGEIKRGPVFTRDYDGQSNATPPPPTIADFDGDGQPEIGIKLLGSYLILDRNLNYKNKLIIPAWPDSYLTSATVFDLNGDGIPEVLINSDYFFRIFDGKSGSLIHEEKFGSGGAFQNAIVADVDNDSHAEVIVVGNNYSNNTQEELRVYGSADNDWVGAPGIWNQTSYHVTNVNDDGSIPQYEAPSWLLNNTYRCQAPVASASDSSSPYLTPNLTASGLTALQEGNSTNLSLRVGNGGAKEAPAGALVTFSDSGVVIGTAATTKTLQPGEYQDILLSVSGLGAGLHQITAVIDSANTIAECNKNDNHASVSLNIAAGVPDLAVGTEDIVLPSGTITEGSIVPVTTTIHNIGAVAASNISVRLYNGNPSAGGVQVGAGGTVAILDPASSASVSFNFDTLGKSGTNMLYIVVDQENNIIEANELNNQAPANLTVQAPTLPNLVVSSDAVQVTPASAKEGETVTVTAIIANRGAAAGDIPVRMSVRSGEFGVGSEVYSETKMIYPILNLGQTATVTTSINTTGLTGQQSVIVTIDPANTITESSKDDNAVSKALFIQSAGLASTVTLDKTAYQAYEAVAVSFTASNSNAVSRAFSLSLAVVDNAGNQIAQINQPESIVINAGAAITVQKTWNTAKTLNGSYTVTAELSEAGIVVSKTSTGFTISPDKSISAKATVDKIAYNPNEIASITAAITSLSPNYIFENLTSTVTISFNNSNVVETKSIKTLMPESVFTFKSYWNTGTYAPGTYPVTLEVKDATGAVIATGNASVVIASSAQPSKLLKGRISVDTQSIFSGDPVNVTYSVTNTGNIDLANVNLSVKTVHAANQTVYDAIPAQTSLATGATYSGAALISTTAYSAKDYLVVLTAEINGIEETLAGTYFRVEGAPTAPSVGAPGNGSDVTVLMPSLVVNNASDPNDDKLSYEFELYSDTSLGNIIAGSALISEQTGTTGWTVPLELQENAWYFWRARAYDNKLYGPWMPAASFRVNTVNDPPTAPVATSPADGSSVSVLAPVLAVTNASDPDNANLTYNFTVALDPEFTRIVSSGSGIPAGQGTTSWQVPLNLEENGTYYWRAQADDSFVTGPWSATAHFFVNTANDAPSVPVVVAPADNSEVATLETDVTVSNSTDPDSAVIAYFFELDIVPTFDSPVRIISGGIAEGQGTTTWHATGLRDNTRYYVRVKASDGSAESAWAAVTTFFANIANDAPTAPVLANPSNGSGVNVFTPALSVRNSTDPDEDILTYDFEIYSDPELVTLVTSTTGLPETPQTTAWTVPVTLAENAAYYWRARAFDGQASSAWMPIASFTVNTANDAPGALALVSPPEGSSVATLTPTLSVNNAVDPDNDTLTCEFEIYSGGVLIRTIPNIPQDSSGTTSVTLGTALADNTIYEWRARAYDGGLYGPWTNNARFTVHVPRTSINATIDFDPDTLNKVSNGAWVVVYIELPTGYQPADIDISSIRLEGTIPADIIPSAIGDHDKDGIPDLMVKFKRSDVINALPFGEKVTVHVSGKVGATTFDGVDVIRVK